MIDIEKAKKIFLKYVEKYDATNFKISYKIGHTFRVVELAEIIAKDLKLEKEDIELARLIGLLHDIGRFEQVKRYNTFSDKNSINHAELGVEILKENDFLSEFCEDKKYHEIILKAIKNHNRFKIEDGLSERELLHAKIIRDADKIDIFKAVGERDLNTLMDETNIDTSEISPGILEDFYQGKQTKKTLLKTAIDEWISYIGMIFDLNFKISFKILKEKNYINIIIDRCSNKEMPKIKEFVNNYIEKKIVS